MLAFWWISGSLLALVWVSRIIAAAFGIRHVPVLSHLEWSLPEGSRPPSVSIIVPARNEAENIEPALRSLLQIDYANYEVIVVNDRSTDATREIIEALVRVSSGKLRVLHLNELPPLWLGKPHAMWQGAQLARGEWLIFTDADVIYRSDAIGRAIAYAESASCDHLALFPDVVMTSVAEQMMIAFFQCAFLFWPRAWKVSDASAHDYVGVGAFNMIRRSAYEAIGTFEKLRMEVVEDLKLGKLVKRHRFRQAAAFGKDLLKIHWIKGLNGFILGLSKNFFAIFDYRWWMALAGCLGIAFLHLLPWIGLVFAPGWSRVGFAFALLSIATAYIGMSMKSDVRLYAFLLQPAATLLTIFTILRSVVLTLLNRGVTWRETKYSLADLRRGLV